MLDELNAMEAEEKKLQEQLEKIKSEKAKFRENHAKELEKEEKAKEAKRKEYKKNSRYPIMGLDVKSINDLPKISDEKGEVFDLKDFVNNMEEGGSYHFLFGNVFESNEYNTEDRRWADYGGEGYLDIQRNNDGSFCLRTNGWSNIHSENVTWEPSMSSEEFWKQVAKTEKYIEGKNGIELPPRVKTPEKKKRAKAEEYLKNVKTKKAQQIVDSYPSSYTELAPTLEDLPKLENGKMEKGKNYLLDEENLPKLKLAKTGHEVDLKNFKRVLANLKNGEELVLGRNPEHMMDTPGFTNNMISLPEIEGVTYNVSHRHAVISRNESGQLRIRDESLNGTKVELQEKTSGAKEVTPPTQEKNSEEKKTSKPQEKSLFASIYNKVKGWSK